MWVAFANAKATHIFSAKILSYMPYLMVKSFNDKLTTDIVSFEQLGPALYYAPSFKKGHIALGLSLSWYIKLLRPLISLEPCMLGFWNFVYALLMKNQLSWPVFSLTLANENLANKWKSCIIKQNIEVTTWVRFMKFCKPFGNNV